MRKSRSSTRRRRLEKRNKIKVQNLIKLEGKDTKNIVTITVKKVTYDFRPYSILEFKPEKGKQKVNIKIRVGDSIKQVEAIAKIHTYPLIIIKEERAAESSAVNKGTRNRAQ